MKTYVLGSNGQGQANITCVICGATSYHPEDIRQRYCGRCHQFHDIMEMAASLGRLHECRSPD